MKPDKNTHLEALRPQNVAELARIVREAAACGRKLALWREAAPDCARLDLGRMKKLREVDTANLLALAEPGIELGVLDAALRAKGVRFAPAQTPFFKKKTLGEFLGRGLPNVLAQKFGPARQQLLGSEIVLADGQVLKTGGRTVKNVTGYDLTRLLNAPLAGLGIGALYLLKLLPLPALDTLWSRQFAELAQVFAFAADLRQSAINPAYGLWFDAPSLKACQASKNPEAALVLLKLEGEPEELAARQDELETLAARHAAAPGPKAVERLLPKLAKLFEPERGCALCGEYSLKLANEPEFIEKVRELAHARGREARFFGQLGQARPCVEFAEHTDKIGFIDEISAICQALGGSLSGGLARQRGAGPQGALARLETSLKNQFDPQGIFWG